MGRLDPSNGGISLPRFGTRSNENPRKVGRVQKLDPLGGAVGQTFLSATSPADKTVCHESGRQDCLPHGATCVGTRPKSLGAGAQDSQDHQDCHSRRAIEVARRETPHD